MDSAPIRAPAQLAAVVDAAPDDGRLPLVLTVGFTGHRALDDGEAAFALIATAFREVLATFEQVASAPYAAAYAGAPRLRLLIGAAPGADRIAEAAWRATGLDGVHQIYPFRDPETGAAYTDQPAKADPGARVDVLPDPEPWTGIDALSLGLEPDQAHAEVARWIVRHADVLVAWWNGEQATAAGGAGDTMAKALERGSPVIWLKPGVAAPRLARIDHIRQHADALEAMQALDSLAHPFDARTLADLLEPVLAPPGDDAPGSRDPEVLARLDYAAVDPLRRERGAQAWRHRLLERTLWRTYARFERIAGALPPVPDAPVRAPPELEAQPGFSRLLAEGRTAAARASHLSSVHRSEQLLLIAIAILAVVVGAAPALTGGPSLSRVHTIAATLEFSLAVVAFFLADLLAGRAHRHRRWSDARRLAERLRAAVATWPLGFDIADAHASAPPTWTEWRARALLRAAGPPRGWIDRPRFEADVVWARDRLIGSQAAYHHRAAHVADHIEGFVRRVEAAAFGVLLLTLLIYLLLSWTQPLFGWNPPHWVGGLVTVVSAVSPAVAAGCLALEATNGFGELALRSSRLEAEFAALGERFDEAGAPPYHHARRLLRRAAELLVEDADAWRDRLLRRRIVRGA